MDDALAIGFWGAFFGSVALMLAGALAAFVRSLHRVALTGASSAVISALFVVAYLRLLPVGDDAVQARLLAHVAVLTSGVLSLMLLVMLGLLRDDAMARRVRIGGATMMLAVLASGWLLEPGEALALSSVYAFTVGVVMLGVCIRSARRGDRLAWFAVAGVTFMLVSVFGLSWIALDPSGVHWTVHAVSAVAGMAYLASMAAALWNRYSYLIELREALAYGPRYDSVTRMRSHSETGQMVGRAFFDGHRDADREVGLIAISIGNLYSLERLHGRAALNHALFVCASRLRRCVPADVEMGRLGDDGFLLLVRSSADPQRLGRLGQLVVERLSRPVVLSTSPVAVESGQARWSAQVGVGVLRTTAKVRPSAVLTMARGMSRTAWSYTSRVAWHDRGLGRVVELPTLGAA